MPTWLDYRIGPESVPILCVAEEECIFTNLEGIPCRICESCGLKARLHQSAVFVVYVVVVFDLFRLLLFNGYSRKIALELRTSNLIAISVLYALEYRRARSSTLAVLERFLPPISRFLYFLSIENHANTLQLGVISSSFRRHDLSQTGSRLLIGLFLGWELRCILKICIVLGTFCHKSLRDESPESRW